MPIALTPHETWEYQLIDDRLPDPDGRRTPTSKLDPSGTVWILGAIPALIQRQIQDAIVWEGENLIHANRGTIIALLLEHGVRSVRNWRDASGSEITIPRRSIGGRDVADLAFLDRLSVAHRSELANAIETRRKVTLEEGD